MQPRTLNQLVAAEAVARLIAFRDSVLHAFPGAVQDVLLFGSRARGDARPDSDYDVAVVLTAPLALDRNVRRQLADAAAAVRDARVFVETRASHYAFPAPG